MKVSTQTLPWFLLGVMTTLLIIQTENHLLPQADGQPATARQETQAPPSPKVLFGRTDLTFRRGQIYTNKKIGLNLGEFKGTPSIVASESGSGGSWAFIKAENFQANSFDIAGLRDPAGKNKEYTAQVAWIAVGEPAPAE